jgi:hypothetical protein
VTGPVDADDERKTAAAARFHAGLGILDDHGPLRNRTESASGLQEHSGVGLAREPEILGGHPVDADAEQVAETGPRSAKGCRVSSTKRASPRPCVIRC